MKFINGVATNHVINHATIFKHDHFACCGYTLMTLVNLRLLRCPDVTEEIDWALTTLTFTFLFRFTVMCERTCANWDS